ncbi:MAG: amidohydrolase family protein [Phycisphaerae bacterium]
MIRRNIILIILAVGMAGIPQSASWARGLDEPPNKNVEAAAKDADDEEKTAEDEKKEDEKEEDRYLAITGAVIHTVTQGVLYHHTLLVKNGKIHQIATTVKIPEEAELLDAAGYHLYPGLVAARSGGVLGGEPPEDNTNVFSLQMDLGLAGGITTAVTGNTAAHLTLGSVDDITIKRDLFERITYSSKQPNARRTLLNDFEKVRQYIRDLEQYRDEKKRDPDAEEPDKEWVKGKYEKYLKLLRGESVALITANDQHAILDVCDFVSRFGIQAVVQGATEGWTVAAEMARAGLGAIITPRRRVASDDRLTRPNGSSIENAAILYRHGVRLAVIPQTTGITLWGLAGRDLLQLNMEAAFAVRGGLSNEAALRAITIDAARILGIDHRVGSVEVGKDADFALTDGDMLHYMTHVRWTVVNGRVVYDKQKDSLYRHIRPDGDEDAPPPDDYWPRQLGADTTPRDDNTKKIGNAAKP